MAHLKREKQKQREREEKDREEEIKQNKYSGRERMEDG